MFHGADQFAAPHGLCEARIHTRIETFLRGFIGGIGGQAKDRQALTRAFDLPPQSADFDAR